MQSLSLNIVSLTEIGKMLRDWFKKSELEAPRSREADYSQ